MSIYGIGTDLVNINRIQRLYNKYGQKFVDKIFVIGKYVPVTYKFVKKEKKGAIIKKINDVGSIIMNHIKNYLIKD